MVLGASFTHQTSALNIESELQYLTSLTTSLGSSPHLRYPSPDQPYVISAIVSIGHSLSGLTSSLILPQSLASGNQSIGQVAFPFSQSEVGLFAQL
jgi:hypothetical protein